MQETIYDESFGLIPFYLSGKEPIFLSVQHYAGHWDFPKGHKEKGESVADTILRELREEAGITEAFKALPLDVSNSYQFEMNGTTYQKTVLYKIGEFPKMPEVTIDYKEIIDFKWGTFDEIRELLTFENTKRMFDEVRKIINSQL